MVRLRERFIFFPMRRDVRFCVVDLVVILSVNSARSSAAALAICAFFSSLKHRDTVTPTAPARTWACHSQREQTNYSGTQLMTLGQFWVILRVL